MATLEQLEQAIRAANTAGRTDDAKLLAAEYQRAKGAPVPVPDPLAARRGGPAAAGRPPEPSGPTISENLMAAGTLAGEALAGNIQAAQQGVSPVVRNIEGELNFQPAAQEAQDIFNELGRVQNEQTMVALFDPVTRTERVFMRNPEMEEGTVESAGRILMGGLGAADPFRAAGRVAPAAAAGARARPTAQVVSDPRMMGPFQRAAAIVPKADDIVGPPVAAPRAAAQGAVQIVDDPTMIGPMMPVELARGPIGKALQSVNKAIDTAFPPETAARSLILERLNLDNISPESIRSRSIAFESRNGRRPTMIELGGENVDALGGAVGGEVGRGRTLINNYYEGVMARQEDVLKGITERALDVTDANFFDDVANLERQMQRSAQPLYEAAHAERIVAPARMQKMVNTPAGQKAIDRAVNIAKQEELDLATLGLRKSQDGRWMLGDDAGEVSVQLLDNIKRGWDDVIEGYRDTTTGVLNLDGFGRAANKTLREYIGIVDELSPAYKAARNSYAGPARLKGALADGRHAGASGRVTSEEIAKRMSKMPPGEQELYRSGFMRGLIDIMEAGGDVANRLNRLIGKGKLRNKIDAVFGDKAAADAFIRQLKEETTIVARAAAISSRTGSPTARRASEQAGLAASMTSIRGAMADALRRGVSFARQNQNIRKDQIINEDVARTLTQPLTDDVIDALELRLLEPKK